MVATLSTPRNSGHPRILPVASPIVFALASVLLLHAVPASAQDAREFSAAALARNVSLDPTTYAPAIIAYATSVRDWDTSQVFFAHGFVEHNDRFTVSGQPDDVPVSYGEGRRRIFNDALVTLGMSAAQNVVSHTIDTYLANRFPEHRKLVKTIGWIQRASLGSYRAYYLSVRHYRQTQDNLARASAMGYR